MTVAFSCKHWPSYILFQCSRKPSPIHLRVKEAIKRQIIMYRQTNHTTPTHRNTKIPSYRPTGFHVNSSLPSQSLLFPARSLLAAAHAGMRQRMADPDAGLPACLALHLRAMPASFLLLCPSLSFFFTVILLPFPFATIDMSC